MSPYRIRCGDELHLLVPRRSDGNLKPELYTRAGNLKSVVAFMLPFPDARKKMTAAKNDKGPE